MATSDEYKEINDKLIIILRDLLAAGDWEATLFLRTAQNKLQAILDQSVALSKQLDQGASNQASEQFSSQVAQGYTKIYVSLYQSDPYNLVKWANTLKSIKEYSINRPIYRVEEYIQEMIRSKHGSPNEGYVAIYIQPSDIIPPYSGKIVQDRWGHELLTLRDNSLLPENIIEFVHQGRRYIFREGRLHLVTDNK